MGQPTMHQAINTQPPLYGFEMYGWTVVYNPENAEEYIAMKEE